MPRPSVRDTSRKSAAARARKQRQLYLTDVLDAGGALVGYRFNPGPGLRAAGARSTLLKRDDGTWMGEAEARTFRDAAVRAASGRAAAPVASPPQPQQRRTLDALWALFLAHHDKLAADGDEDAIAPRTRAFYVTMIKPWLAWGGHELVAAFDAETVLAEYKAQRYGVRDRHGGVVRAARGHSTAHAGLRAMMALMAFGVRIKWVRDNPMLKLGVSRPQGRLRLGTPEEVAALVTAADALDEEEVGTAIVAGLWTGQRLDDLLACDLGTQLRDGVLIFARTHEQDFSQGKTGGQAQVRVLEPLARRIGLRTEGLLIPMHVRRVRKTNAPRWLPRTFNTRFLDVRAEAMKACPSLHDFTFRDLRDTAVTRLHLARIDVASIALWTGHSMKSIQSILEKHYLVSTRDGAMQAGAQFDEWRKTAGVKW